MFRLLNKSSGYLFASIELRQMLEQRLDALRSEVNNLEPNRFLNTAPADLAKYLVEKYTVDAPHLKREEWSMSERETKIDVSQDHNRCSTDRSRPFYVPGQRIEVEIPFDGDADPKPVFDLCFENALLGNLPILEDIMTANLVVLPSKLDNFLSVCYPITKG